MITKIIKLKNVGLIGNACPSGAVDFQPVTTIYAENGRGKSTLAAVLRACAERDPGRVKARTTIDKSEDPEIEILFDGNNINKYDGAGWNGAAPSMLLFDAEFVETNVYSGFSVRPDQRQELLEFALGEKAVQAKRKADELTEQIASQTRVIGQNAKILEALSPKLTAAQCAQLEAIDASEANGQINALQERIRVATNAEQINQRQVPKLLQPMVSQLEPVFEVLARELRDIETEAEIAVRNHFAKHADGGDFQGWISQGQSYLTSDACPFCDQPLADNDLIGKYKSYFNEVYRSLKDRITGLPGEIDAWIPGSFADNAISDVQLNEARITAWEGEINLDPPAFDADGLKILVEKARQDLLDLVQRKALNPIEATCSKSEQHAIIEQIEQIKNVISNYNNSLQAILSNVSKFKSTIDGEDIETLEDQVRILRVQAQLGTPNASDARDAYLAAEQEKQQLEGLKDAAREKGDELIRSSLVNYNEHINTILNELGAEFSISSLSQDYRGGRGAPRAGYGIKIRDQQVALNTSPNFSAGHTFATTLSEADKRTLALAVFIARLETEDHLASKIVILDDPVSSMDQNRRHQTIRRVVRIASQCQQLIILSHDAHFLREFNERLVQSNATPPRVMQLARVGNGYSAFSDCELNEICESAYYRHFRMIEDFVDGNSSADARDVAKAIRPLLEGFLHRRFPVHIPRGEMLGPIIHNHIKPASSGPLTNMQHCLHELDAVNDYTKQFHHDPSTASDAVSAIDAQLLHFARKALNIIYGAI